MRVEDVMTRRLVTVPPETTVLDAQVRLTREGIRHLLVTDEGGELLGIVTDRDIRLNLPSPATSLSVWEMKDLLSRLTVGEIMTKAVVTVGPRREVSEAAVLMLEHKIGALPVLEDGRLAGIVTETDLLRALAAAG
jgi:acetoin utilization protein AcuB